MKREKVIVIVFMYRL